MSIEVHRLRWRGRADAVAVLTFMPRFPHRLPMVRGDDGWWVDLHLPHDARIEYRLEIRRGHRVETTLDPANPEVATNPFGENSVLRARGYPPAPAGPPPIGWSHTEFRVTSAVFGGRRHHHLLSPLGISPREPLPLVVLHDGSDYHRHADLQAVIGSAVASGRLPFLRMALLDPRHRDREYAADPSHAAHVATEVVPHIADRVGVAAQRVVGGASLGAVASWHAVATHPGVFTGLALQSGTFAFTGHAEIPPPMAVPIRAFLDRAIAGAPDVAVGQSCGRYESLIDWNRQVAGWWSAQGVPHRYTERWTGHDWGAWSDYLVGDLAAALAR